MPTQPDGERPHGERHYVLAALCLSGLLACGGSSSECGSVLVSQPLDHDPTVRMVDAVLTVKCSPEVTYNTTFKFENGRPGSELDWVGAYRLHIGPTTLETAILPCPLLSLLAPVQVTWRSDSALIEGCGLVRLREVRALDPNPDEAVLAAGGMFLDETPWISFSLLSDLTSYR